MPDPGNVLDYNRYLYARGNPLKYNDPTGHYSNDEIMQHFGVDSWEGVESIFSEGGSHAGLWGWLYIPQQAQNGDAVAANRFDISSEGRGTIRGTLSGSFERAAGGAIGVTASSLATAAYTYSYGGGVAMTELAFASFAANGADFGSYQLGTGTASSVEQVHNYLYMDAGQAGLAALKAGVDLGPLIIAAAPQTGPAAPFVVLGGVAYTAVGTAAFMAWDIALPLVQAYQGNSRPIWNTIGVELGARGIAAAGAAQISPFVGPVYDFSRSFCYGTGCPR